MIKNYRFCAKITKPIQSKRLYSKISPVRLNMHCKFRQIGVLIQYSFSRQILKVCNLGRIKAWYWKPKIVFSWSTNTSPVRTLSNIIVHSWILIRVKTFFTRNASLFVLLCKFYQNTSKSRILKFRFKYYWSRVITPDWAPHSYPSKSRIPIFFRVAKRGRVIRRKLMHWNCLFYKGLIVGWTGL